jgi:FkbM family methyltransferase
VPLTALLLRARTVSPSLAFVARELLGRRGLFRYRERVGGMTVLVRHGSADPVTLGEVFHERDYEPPPEVPLGGPRHVVDLGANVGYFGAFALGRWPEARVVAYEPDPANAAVHLRAIALNGLADRWELRRAAAAAADGELRFRASGDALSRADASGELVVRSEDVLPVAADADLLKLDVEGAELDVIRGAADTLARGSIDVIQFEFGGTNIDARTYFQDFFYLLNPSYRLYRIVADGLALIDRYRERYEIFETTNFVAFSRRLPAPA